jgi:hypothetical protein
MPTMPPLQGVGGDHPAVEVGCGVEVVVVVVEAGVGELLGLAFLQHAQGHAGLQAERLHLAHHLEHRGEVLVLRPAPGGTHAEAAGAARLGRARVGEHLVDREQALAGETAVVAGGLRAVAAVFRAAAGLDREQGGALHFLRVEVAAMHLLGAEDELEQGQLEERLDLGGRPLVAGRGRCGAFDRRGSRCHVMLSRL